MAQEALNTPIPLALEGASETISFQITYGVYLAAVRRFVLDNFDQVLEAVNQRCGGIPQIVDSIDLIAEKHGGDYHPARVRIHTAGALVSFVANVAVTSRGWCRLEEDFRLLQHLREKYGECSSRFLPSPYFTGSVRVDSGDGRELGASIFLAEWFDGYHEFHLSMKSSDRTPDVVLWDNDAGHRVLSVQESLEIYRQASFILTGLYDADTFQEVFPWHHAAGDFIASGTNRHVDVKLVTVRQYSARVTFEKDDPLNRMHALLLFLANLTVRMRLDRLDGVGDTGWADDRCVEAVLRGFWDALPAKEAAADSGADLTREFKDFVSSLSLNDLVDVFRSVVGSYDSEAPDLPVVVEHLPDHIFQVFQRLRVAVGCQKG